MKAHDLVSLHDTNVVATIVSDAPKWVETALLRSPWVVVRRALTPAGVIPIGVRGLQRSERWGAEVPLAALREKLCPEDLINKIDHWNCTAPAAITLKKLRKQLDLFDYPWGPTGSAGFELASGCVHVTNTSDLDLVFRCDRTPLKKNFVMQLHHIVQCHLVHIDTQLELHIGAVALDELVSGSKKILVKRASGPILVEAADCGVGE